MTIEPLIFIHIPRTGGISLCKMMDEVYGYESIGRPWWGEHEGEPLTDEQKDKAAWYGHFKFGLHRAIGRPIRYITIIREPAARLLSEYHRNDYRHRYSMTPMDLARDPEKGCNLMTRLLAGASRTDALRPSDVDRAIVNIEKHFAFVGETEHYPVLYDFLCKDLGWPLTKLLHENKGKTGTVSVEELAQLRDMPELALDYELYKRLTYA